MKRRRRVITISLPPEVAEEYEKLARKEAKNRSQLFREMFQFYKKFVLEQEFLELQRYGTTPFIPRYLCLLRQHENSGKNLAGRSKGLYAYLSQLAKWQRL